MGLLAKLTDPKLAEPDVLVITEGGIVDHVFVNGNLVNARVHDYTEPDVEDDEILCVDAEGNVYTEGFTMGAGK